jgi:ketosteroid isomerase-like protein
LKVEAEVKEAAKETAAAEETLLPATVERPLVSGVSTPATSAPAPPQPTVFAELASRIDSGVRKRAVFAPEQQREEQAQHDLPDLKLGAGGSHRTGVPMFIAAILAIAVAAGSVYLYWIGRLNLEYVRQMISRQAPQPTVAPPAQPAATPSVTEVQPPPEPPPPARHEEPNVKLWLDEWADAIRGRDPVLQASFYADPVASYLGESDMSAEDLTAEFRSAIQSRDGLWTFKVENVSVDPKSSTDVLVRLTKHFMQLDDSSQSASNQIADKYVRSRLELRKMDGEWKIVSEQDLIQNHADSSGVSSRM